MASPAWEADKMLDAYIYDYLHKRKLARSAEAFMVEANISPDPVAIDAPGGFLFEWWSVFWDIFIARTNEKHSEVAHSYIEAQQAKVKEQQQQALQQQQAAQLQVAQQLQQQQQAQQGLSSQQQAGSHWQLLQSQLQQQRQAAQRRETAPNGSTPPGLSAENLLRQSPANLLATKLYQDNLKGASRLPDGLSLDEAILKRFSETNSGHGLQPQQAAMLRSASSNAAGLQNSLSELDNSIARQLLAANGPGNAISLQQARSQLLSPTLTQDDKASLMGRQNSPPRGDMVAALSKAGFSGAQLVNQAGGKNWPAANIEQIRQQQQQQAAQQQLQQAAQQQQAAAQQQQHSQQQAHQQQQAVQSQGQLQRQGSNVSAGQFQFQSPQQYQQFQMLSPLQQRELLLHAQQQQQAAASGVSQQERLRQMMAGKGFGHEGSQNGSPGASSGSQGQGQALPLQQQELLLKQLQAQRSANQLQAQFHQQQQQVAAAAAALQKGGSNTPGNSPHLQQLIRQGSNHSLQGLGGNGLILPPGADHPATSTDSRKTGKGAGARKRKQPGTNSNAVPTSSTGTGTTVGGSMAVGPEPPTPTNNRSEALLASLQHSSEALRGNHGGFGEGRADAPASSDPGPEDGSIDHVETFLSTEAADEDQLRNALFAGGKRDKPDPKEVVTSGFSFAECGVLRASTGKVVSCHFSVDGKILATAGHDKKAILWDVGTQKVRSRLEEHTLIVTDVRFAATSNRLATSSFDKTVRVWDADSESACSLRVFARHQQTVMSVDFHPANDDMVCSCDSDGEVRMWSVDKGTCTRVFKGASMQVRFQPRTGLLLAMASEGSVTMYDVESEQCRIALQRHSEPLQAVCWEPNGDVMASVSEDSVRIWAFGSGASEGECLHELISSGNKFQSCVFHPTYASLLVIGCYESLELWNMMENKSMTVMAHEGLIASLAQSPVTGMVASASHDKSVKLWK